MWNREIVPARSVGLACVGAISRSWVAQLPGLSGWLGPVRALTAAASTRVVQSLRAGAATDNWAVMAGCPVVLIYAETGSGALVRAMAESGSTWTGTAMVLCSQTEDSRALDGLKQLGAHTGSLSVLEEGPYLVEGDPGAARLIQGILGGHRSKLVKVRREAKLPLLAQLEASLEGALPSLTQAAAHLRDAGLSAAAAQALVLSAFQREARTRLKSPRRSPAPLAPAEAEDGGGPVAGAAL